MILTAQHNCRFFFGLTYIIFSFIFKKPCTVCWKKMNNVAPALLELTIQLLDFNYLGTYLL